jgi:hypothetical protein
MDMYNHYRGIYGVQTIVPTWPYTDVSQLETVFFFNGLFYTKNIFYSARSLAPVTTCIRVSSCILPLPSVSVRYFDISVPSCEC